MSRSLDDLDPEIRPLVDKFLAKLVDLRLFVMIIDTLRTEEEQKANIKNGVSWTMKSKHLPHPPSGKSRAIDICPVFAYTMYGANKLQWDGRDPSWEKIGKIGEALGFTWGGRWKQKDLGHFEI